MPLATRILWGLVIGVVAALATLGIGQLYPPFLKFMQDVSGAVFDPFGQVFLRMLFFVVMPLVFSSLASGVTRTTVPCIVRPDPPSRDHPRLQGWALPGARACSELGAGQGTPPSAA